jgi:hypothetical protein
MISAFLGTLIALERAVAIKRPWAWGAPLLSGLGGLAVLLGLPGHLAHGLAAAGAAILVVIFIRLYRQQAAMYLATIGVGALLWLVGVIFWHLADPLYRVIPWWVGFLVLTIAGERLELSRLVRLPRWMGHAFLVACGLVLAGLVLGRADLAAGIRLSGVGLLALALWLLRGDIAWRTVTRPGRSHFMALCLLSGHLWLGAGGVLWMIFAPSFVAGAHYDAMLHSILLGFVFSMIFGHAPIILPSVLGVALPFRRAFYAHWALLHLSLVLRIGGDLAGWPPGTHWGGLGNTLAIVLFLGNSIRAIVSAEEGRGDAE